MIKCKQLYFLCENLYSDIKIKFNHDLSNCSDLNDKTMSMTVAVVYN